MRLLTLCLSLAIIFTSCVSKKKYTELMDNKTSVDEMLLLSQKKAESLESEIENLQNAKEALTLDYQSKSQKMEATIEEMIGQLKAAKEKIVKTEEVVVEKEAEKSKILEEIRSVFNPYIGEGMTLKEKNGRYYVSVPSPITYKSGSTKINKAHEHTLVKLTKMLQENPGMQIMVEGHTDAKKMKSGARYANNMALSLARAENVVNEMVKFGANPVQLTSIGRGDSNLLITDADSPELHQMNRRTEFVVIPNISNLNKYKMEEKKEDAQS